MKIVSIKKEIYQEWLLKKHYAKRLCSVSYAFGLYIDGVLNGVCTFGQSPSSNLSNSILDIDCKKFVLELNRLVVNDNLKKNTLSFFVSQSINKLPSNKIIVSFADANQGHHGFIYQATNFIYTGETSNTSKLIDKDGHEFHFRNIGHYQKNNKLKVNLVKRRINEELINKKEIANFLRKNKKDYTNKFIEKNLNIPISTIEHWFRLDAGFSFPSIEHWIKLKNLLNFEDTYDSKMLSYELIPDANEIIKKLELKKIDILPKHRYIFFKGNKTFKKNCYKNLKLNILPYPKGNNKRYDNSYTPAVQLAIL